jgi:hypothetical protein
MADEQAAGGSRPRHHQRVRSKPARPLGTFARGPFRAQPACPDSHAICPGVTFGLRVEGMVRRVGRRRRSRRSPDRARPACCTNLFSSAIAELLGSGTVVCGDGGFASSISISFRPLGDAASSRARSRRPDVECPECGQSNRDHRLGLPLRPCPAARRSRRPYTAQGRLNTLAVGAAPMGSGRRYVRSLDILAPRFVGPGHLTAPLRRHAQLAPFRDALASSAAGRKVPEARAPSVGRWCALPSGAAT